MSKPSSRTHAHPLPFGAELIGPRRTRFRLWAPGADEVAVEIDGVESIAMAPVGDGWHQAEVSCGAGARYKYRVSKDLSVPDPASRLQSGDVHDPSVVVDPKHYTWQHTRWRGRPWCETVFYELHVGAFGGYRGVIEQLPRLAELGITAVELMPVNDFPGTRNWGYDGVLPYAPDASYGTPDELKELVDTAHGLGLMVFLDVVYNHFGPDGNYLHAYAADFFDATQASPWGVAIDFSRRQVRDYFIENALYWLQEYRFDGLRFDATDQIKDNGFLTEMAERIRSTVDADRHVHLVLENGDNVAHQIGWSRPPDGKAAAPRRRTVAPPTGQFSAQWCDDAHHAYHVLLTGEAEGYYIDYADMPAAKLARTFAEGFIYQGDRSRFRNGGRRGEPSAHLPPTAFVSFIQNHDQIGNRAMSERLTTLAADEALAAAYTALLLGPQIPLLFMGEEWGSRTPFFFFTDHHGELAKAVRDGRRREFASFGGFADEARAKKIPDPNNAGTFRISVANADEAASAPHDAVLERTRRLLRLRQKHLMPRLQGARSHGAEVLGDAAVTARWTLGDGSRLSLHLNLGPAAVRCKRSARGELLAESRHGAAELLAAGTLHGFAAVVRLEAAPASAGKRS